MNLLGFFDDYFIELHLLVISCYGLEPIAFIDVL